MEVQGWSQQQFGAAADELRRAAVRALTDAHALAAGAHVLAEMTAGDTYGNTIFVKSNELLLEYGSAIPGVVARKPKGQNGRFKLLVVEETNTAIYVWRYSDDPSKVRAEAQFKTPVSGLQSAMAALSRGRDDQLTIDDAAMTDAELADRDDLDAVLRQRGSVAFLAYGASYQAGLFAKGFAQISQLSGEGRIRWDHWEPLPDLVELSDVPGRSDRPSLRVVDPETNHVRFDAADDRDNDDLDIRPRHRAEAEHADAETETKSGEDAAGSLEGDK